MAEELTLARKNGNLGCIVAAGLNMPGADNTMYLTKLSQASGVKVVAAAAYYTPQSYPRDTDVLSEDAIADLVITSASESRLGAYGELGCANDEADLQPIEKKVFRAFAILHAWIGPVLDPQVDGFVPQDEGENPSQRNPAGDRTPHIVKSSPAGPRGIYSAPSPAFSTRERVWAVQARAQCSSARAEAGWITTRRSGPCSASRARP